MSAGWHLAALIVAAVPLIGHGAEPPIDANATVVSAVQIEQQLQTPGKTRGFVVLGAQADPETSTAEKKACETKGL